LIMNCDTIQNRILALAVATEPTADVREHVAGCPACQAMLAKAVRLDRVLANLPAPTAELAKQTLIEQVLAEGPVIRTKPVAPSSVGSGTFKRVGKWLTPKLLGGLAAGVLVAIGGVWFLTRPKPTPTEPELAAKPKHELLARSVKHHVDLSKSATAPERLNIFTEWSAEVSAEAKDVYKAASREELSKFAALYESTVAGGVIEQAKKLEENPERAKHLQTTMNLLTTTAAETSSLAAEAPPDAQAAFKRMATAADKARTELRLLLAKRGA
jgi:hypothetical protein